MKKILLSATLIFIGVLLSIQSLSADTLDIKNELKETASGSVSNRFRGGFFVGAGYGGRIGGDGYTAIQGITGEAGLYGLFNPIQNFVDIEVGVSGKYNFGTEDKKDDGSIRKYYSGLKQVTVYGGPVFRFAETKKAVGIGLSKALYMDEVLSDEQKKDGVKKHDLENGIGAYIEYQADILKNNNIFFARAEVEQIDIVSATKTDKDTVGSIIIGYKY
jgi:hypothetical protein